MTTKQDLETILISAIQNDFDTEFGPGLIAWANGPFDYNNPPETYVQARVSLDNSEGLAVNSPLDRHFGNIYFVVITKPGVGTLMSNEMVDFLFKAYRHQSFSGIEVRGAKMAGEGPSHDGWEAKVTIPFVTSPV